MTTINNFDELTDFKDGEDEKYLVEYILADDGGFCHRASPFLMPVGTVFEHEYGTYEVKRHDIKVKHIIVYCERLDKGIYLFSTLFSIRTKFN